MVCETASENNQIAFQAFLAKPSLSGLPLLQLLLTIPPLKPLRWWPPSSPLRCQTLSPSLSRCSLLHHPYSAIAKPNPSSLHLFGSLLLLAVVFFFCAIAASFVWPLPPVARLPCKRLRVQIPLRTYTTFQVLSGSCFFFFFFLNFIEPLVQV